MAKSKPTTTKKLKPPTRWKKFQNWCYDKWMRFRGYKPYMWDMKEHRNTYVKQAELDEMVHEAEKLEEAEEEYEEIFYQRQESDAWYRDKETDAQAKMMVAKALRKGEDDARIIRRPLQGE